MAKQALVIFVFLLFNTDSVLTQQKRNTFQFDLLEFENSTEGGILFDEYPDNPLIYVAGVTDTAFICAPGQEYDDQLAKCRVACAVGEAYVESTNTCEQVVEGYTHANATTKKAPTCRNMTIPSTEFQISKNSLLVNLTGLRLSPENFKLLANGSLAAICYPFSQAFRSCSKWQFNVGEFEVRHSGLEIWVPDQKRSYLADEFGLPQGDTGIAVTCRPTINEAQAAVDRAIIDGFAAAWTVSAVSLFIAFVVYFFRMSKLKTHDKMLLCHIASLFVVSILFILRLWGPPPTPRVCMAYGILIHFSFLAAFCWINVLAFDIWRRFPSLSNFNDLSRQGNDTLRFMKHSIYAWGIPFLVILTAVLYDIFQTDDSNIFKPSYDVNCWLNANYSRLVFFYGPVAVILASNVVFFALTVWKIRRFGQGAERVNKNIHRQLIRLYLKLMIVMGLCWIMEIVSWAVGGDQVNWYFTDILNALQGFFLFIVYVCKPSILKSLRRVCGRKSCCRRKSTSHFYFPSSENCPQSRHMSISFQNSNLSDSQPTCTSQLSTVSEILSRPNQV